MKKMGSRFRQLTAALVIMMVLGLMFNNCSSSNSYNVQSLASPTDSAVPSVPGQVPTPIPIKGAPFIFYTDLASGPNSGGDQNLGAYLSLFGKNFGSDLNSIHVYINNVEVAQKILLTTAKGRSDIQQISVRVGSLAGSPVGLKLPISITVNGIKSNTDQTFIINAGRLIYVDPVKGDDTSARMGDITKPFKTIQTSDLSAGAWGLMQPGDTLILRGGTYVGKGFENYFMRFMLSSRASGTAPTGAAKTGYLSLVGYPGEDAFINCTATQNPSGCLSGLNGQTFPEAGKFIVIAGLRIEGGGYDGPISQEIYGDNWRIINNEITAFTGVTSGSSPSRMAGITGNGINSYWFGNHIHDIQGSQYEAHGIYIDGDGSYEIAYNHIHDIKSGKGLQVYVNGGNGSNFCNNVNIHHNSIHNTLQFGINIADGSSKGFIITNNLIYNAGASGLRFNTTDLTGAKIYNNTFVNNNTTKNTNEGAVSSDWNLPTGSLELKNNIIVAIAGTNFIGGSVGFSTNQVQFSNNLWFGGSDSISSLENKAILANPSFVSLVSKSEDFHLKAGSPAIDKGLSGLGIINDFDIITARPLGAGVDLGAYESY